jgi:hypothetical protein
MADDLEAQLASLREAYRSGATTISYEGKSVSYRNAEDLRAAIASIEAELGIVHGRSTVVRSTKGW